MSMEENKAIVRRFHEEAWNRGNVEVMDELYLPDCSRNGTAVLPGMKTFIREYRSAILDLKVTLKDMIAERYQVVTRWSMGGTNPGPVNHPKLGLLPPTGKPFSVTGITIQRVMGGKIVDEVFEAGWTDMLIQMGVIPAPNQSSS